LAALADSIGCRSYVRSSQLSETFDAPTARDLAARFAACAIAKAEWTHDAHVMVGAWFVEHHGASEATAKLREGIRRLNEHHGTPNSETSGYHETITRAYVQLLESLFGHCPDHLTFEDRVELLRKSRLRERTFLFTFYSQEVLRSATARHEWVEPDLSPLRCSCTGT
jgi:hypothetical protein